MKPLVADIVSFVLVDAFTMLRQREMIVC